MSRRPQLGSVTAEAALVLPLLVGVAGLLVWLLAAGVAQVQCVDAARDAVRALARDEPEPKVLAQARAATPDGAVVELERAGDTIEVHVSYAATPPGGLLDQLLSLPLEARASMPVEVGDPDG